MKKIMVKSLVLILTLALALGSFVYASQQEIKVLLDGDPIVFDVQPTIIGDRTMVPLRAIFEALGAKVDYDNDTRTITAEDESTKVILVADSTQMSVNGEIFTLDVPATIIDGRTLVPVRAISEAFKCEVGWDAETYTVIITSPEEVPSETPEEDDLYSYPSPVIDFTGDDGTMSQLHHDVRLVFEQETMPMMIYENTEILADVIVNDPEQFLTYIDNMAWTNAMNYVLATYMLNSDEVFEISAEEDIYKIIGELADKYKLHAYQSFDIDAIMLGENKYCILLNMADIDASLKIDELDKMLISTYVAVVYDSDKKEFGYYTLEKSLDDYYMFCSIPASGSHVSVRTLANDKRAFVEALTEVVNK